MIKRGWVAYFKMTFLVTPNHNSYQIKWQSYEMQSENIKILS